MLVGKSITRSTPGWVDWRPLTASCCLHFLAAIACAVFFFPQAAPPASFSLARVTLQTTSKQRSFDEDESEQAPSTKEITTAGNGLPDAQEASWGDWSPELTAQDSSTGARPISAVGSRYLETPGRGPFSSASGGNSAADEKLMEADYEKWEASKPPSGPSAKISLFGGELSGHSFVFVIDRSASTSSKYFAACSEIERQCAKAIDSLPAENRFQVVLYNDRVSPVSMLRKASEEEKRSAKEQMIRFVPYGGTMHRDALLTALKLRANVVCWFSDGGDPLLRTREIEELTLMAAKSRTTIHAWRLGKHPGDPSLDFMRRLTESTGGDFHEGIPQVK